MPEDPTTFGPREPVVGVYEGTHPSLLLERALFAFQSVLMIPAPVVSRKFREHLHKAIIAGHPGLRCSAARAILEGRIPGVPRPTAEQHSSSAKRIQQTLCLLDIFETIAHVYIQEQEQNDAKQDQKTSPGDGRCGPRKGLARYPKKGRPRVSRGRQKVRDPVD